MHHKGDFFNNILNGAIKLNEKYKDDRIDLGLYRKAYCLENHLRAETGDITLFMRCFDKKRDGFRAVDDHGS